MFRLGRRRELTHTAGYEGVLGTSLDLTVSASTEATGAEAERRIIEEIERLDAVFSTYRPDSEFMRWQGSHGEPVVVSRDLAHVLGEAEKWRTLSDGVFLPVVEEWTRQWRMRETGHFPGDEPHIDPAEPLWSADPDALVATRFTRNAASLDAIAKGYIIDRTVEAALEVPGVRRVLVNIGGDLRHGGAGSSKVSVIDPREPADNGTAISILKISNMAMATSGGYRRGFSIGPERYSHIFDPRLGKPVGLLRSASVIAPTAMLADVFATIVGVLSPKEGLAFADRFASIGVLAIDDAGDCHRNQFWSSKQLTSPTPK